MNHTNDVEGAKVFRNLNYAYIKNEKTNYNVISLKKVDKKLNNAGINHGGHLKKITNKELCKILNADGLLFIKINKLAYDNYGISSKRIVKAKFKLYNVDNKIWADKRKIKEGKSTAEGVVEIIANPGKSLAENAIEFAFQIGGKAIKGMAFDHELAPEMKSVIYTSFSTLPN